MMSFVPISKSQKMEENSFIQYWWDNLIEDSDFPGLLNGFHFNRLLNHEGYSGASLYYFHFKRMDFQP